MKLVTILVMLLTLAAIACEEEPPPPPAQAQDVTPPTATPVPEPTPAPDPTAEPTATPVPTARPVPDPTPEPEPTAAATSTPVSEPTATPEPTAEAIVAIAEGTHRVGTDIQPGIYAGKAGTDILDSCSWRRLSGVSGDSDEILAIEIEQGQFYVEILPSDKYFQVGCEITAESNWPTPSEFPSELDMGTYLVGRDISHGTYAGKAGTDILDSCSWRRLSGVSGDSDEILAIEIEQGQFYVAIEESDFAFQTSCPLTLEE